MVWYRHECFLTLIAIESSFSPFNMLFCSSLDLLKFFSEVIEWMTIFFGASMLAGFFFQNHSHPTHLKIKAKSNHDGLLR